MEQKGWELIIPDHERDLCVTVVGWVDVRVNERGDFRRQVCRRHI